jgi:hypothetical protein
MTTEEVRKWVEATLGHKLINPTIENTGRFVPHKRYDCSECDSVICFYGHGKYVDVIGKTTSRSKTIVFVSDDEHYIETYCLRYQVLL